MGLLDVVERLLSQKDHESMRLQANCTGVLWLNILKAEVAGIYSAIVSRPKNETFVPFEGNLVIMSGPFSHFRNSVHAIPLFKLLLVWNAISHL